MLPKQDGGDGATAGDGGPAVTAACNPGRHRGDMCPPGSVWDGAGCSQDCVGLFSAGARLGVGAGSAGRMLHPAQILPGLCFQRHHRQPLGAALAQRPTSTHAPGKPGAALGCWQRWHWEHSGGEIWGGCSILPMPPAPSPSPASTEKSSTQPRLQPTLPCTDPRGTPPTPSPCPPGVQVAVGATSPHHKLQLPLSTPPGQHLPPPPPSPARALICPPHAASLPFHHTGLAS